MAFWGIEVKPGKPFTQKFDDFKGRLHVSLATLGFGTATNKSVLQCNVGNKSPVYLCSLFPEKNECTQLNLEYEEADEVIFSVIGPRSIHLSGYFLGSYRHNNLNDDTESYGEDIANTETQSSEYADEDNYDDSFINDADPEVLPPSPIPKEEDDAFDKNKTRNRTRSRRRLRKSYQMSESDDDEGCQHKDIANTGVPGSELESLDEDNHPISSLCKNKTNEVNGAVELEVREHKGIHETNDKKTVLDDGIVTEVKGKTDCAIGDGQPNSNEAGEINFSVFATGVCSGSVAGPSKLVEAEGQTFQGGMISSNSNIKEATPEHNDATIDKLGQHLTLVSKQETDLPTNSLPHSSEASTRVGNEQKKKRKERSKRKPVEADGNGCSYVLMGVDAEQDELTTDNKLDTLSGEKQEANNGAELLDNLSFPSADVGPEDSERPKKKKKRGSELGKTIDCNGTVNLKPDKMDQDVQPTFDQTTEIENNLSNFVTENHSIAKKIKKKKKSQPLENGDSLKSDISLSKGEKQPSDTEIEDKESDGDTKSSQVRTLPKGLVIEELEAGKPHGKIATSEKKISVLYVGKLKENGEIIDSTDDRAPFKFRLGVGQVIEGWDAGLDGMRVGERRRLTIPPSMGYGSKGDGEKIPPDSWLEYEVELVKVH